MKPLFLGGTAALLLASTSAGAAAFLAPLAPARGLPPVGQVLASWNPDAQQIRFQITAAAGALAPGEHQLHLHANYAGNLNIGDPLTAQVQALPPALTDDRDGDGVLELFEAVPVIGESWWTIATVTVGADGALNYDSGVLSTANAVLNPPDPIEPGSPGVDDPADVDNPINIDNIGFYRQSLDQFPLLAFDIHGGNDPAGIGNTPGEIDEIDGYEALRPALGGAFAPVPEPATWAMMIAGFGFAGAAVRRRRAKLLPA